MAKNIDDIRFCKGCGVPISIGGKTIHMPGCPRRVRAEEEVG